MISKSANAPRVRAAALKEPNHTITDVYRSNMTLSVEIKQDSMTGFEPRHWFINQLFLTNKMIALGFNTPHARDLRGANAPCASAMYTVLQEPNHTGTNVYKFQISLPVCTLTESHWVGGFEPRHSIVGQKQVKLTEWFSSQLLFPMNNRDHLQKTLKPHQTCLASYYLLLLIV